MPNQLKLVRRCKKCHRLLRSWNKSGFCLAHYQQAAYQRKQAEQKEVLALQAR